MNRKATTLILLALITGCNKPAAQTAPAPTPTAATPAKPVQDRAYMEKLMSDKGYLWKGQTGTADSSAQTETWTKVSENKAVTTYMTVIYKDGIAVDGHTLILANE